MKGIKVFNRESIIKEPAGITCSTDEVTDIIPVEGFSLSGSFRQVNKEKLTHIPRERGHVITVSSFVS
jgi:hypothetical protein